MRKNGARLISFKQYKLTDIFIFGLILIAFDLIVHFAPTAFAEAGGNFTLFTFTLTVPLTLMVMVRWGWPSVFFGVIDGALFCILNGLQWQSYLVFILGNSFIMLLLILVKFVGAKKIAGKWYFSALFVIFGWVLVVLGRATVAAIVGLGFVQTFLGGIFGDLLSLFGGVVLIMIMRRLDGMFEDQKSYLKRVDEERRELARRDEFGDEPVEIDEETMSILRKKDDDLYR